MTLRFLLVAVATALTAAASPPLPAPVEAAARRIVVDQTGHDGAFRSIQAALDFAEAKEAIRGTPPLTIAIRPGIYRESLTLRPGSANIRLVAEGRPDGRVVISGADPVQSWKRRPDGLFCLPLPHPLPLSVPPDDWPSRVTRAIPRAVRVRNMVFLNGQHLLPAVSIARLTNRSFVVLPSRHEVLVRLDGPLDGPPHFEVAVRPTLLEAHKVHHLELVGLTFQQAANELEQGAVVIDNADAMVLDDIDVRENNDSGLSITSSHDIAIGHSRFDDNGGTGLNIWKVRQLTVDHVVAQRNGWHDRLSPALVDWAIAGIKASLLHTARFQHATTDENMSRGFWLDYDVQDVTIDALHACDNTLDGLTIEAAQGHLTVSGSTLCSNGRAGLLAAGMMQVSFDNNTVACNRHGQLRVSGDLDRPVEDFATGRRVVVNNAFWTMENNTIAAAAGEPLLVSTLPVAYWERLNRTIRSNGNRWFPADGSRPVMLRQPSLAPAALEREIATTVGKVVGSCH